MLSFGLVNVPVGLYSATEQKDVHFHQFERRTNRRIRNMRVAEGTRREVDYDDIVKGYELDSGEYVMLTQEELESVEPGRSRTIEITDFVELAEIDPIYYERSYYLAPQGEGGEKAYALLLRAMEQAGLAGVARFVMRARQYLATIRHREDVLVLETMFFSDEVRDPQQTLERLPVSAKVGKRELDVAVNLVEQLKVDWDPERYEDIYRERVLDLIKAKQKGEKVEVAAEEPTATNVVDLVEALRASVAATPGKSGKSGTRGKPRTGPTTRGQDDLTGLSKKRLYERAQRLDVPGRSQMSRKQLEAAIRKAS
jgi:DNA end-binding protein Ku